jgi:hypothetical protein
MAIEKYIIDKSDLTALLKGEDLAIQPKGNIKGFCVEIAGNLTNGDMIKAMFPELKVEENIGSIYMHGDNEIFLMAQKKMWNAPYKKEVEE